MKKKTVDVEWLFEVKCSSSLFSPCHENLQDGNLEIEKLPGAFYSQCQCTGRQITTVFHPNRVDVFIAKLDQEYALTPI
jgi:hypothetical protein